MITEDKINKIYEAVGAEQELTTKLLNELGFNSNDLTKLINNGILTRLKRGYYDIVQIEPLYNYGISMLDEDEKRAYKYFKKCYEIDSNYGNLMSKLFSCCIYVGDYTQALKYLDLSNVSNKITHNNNNFYLYLLSKLSPLPDEYQKMVNQFHLDDIQFIPNTENQNVSRTMCRQTIRRLAFNNEYTKALKIRIEGNLTSVDNIINILLKNIAYMKKVKMNRVLQEIKNKNYIVAKETLETSDDLSFYEHIILSLLQTLNIIITEEIIPNKLDFKSISIYEAIADKNYEWALYLYECKYNNSKTHNMDSDILYLLLVAINKEIHRLENNHEKQLYEIQESKDESFIDPELICPALVHLLLQHDLERFMQYLPEYLSILKKDKYQDIIGYLLELDTLEQDGVFTKTVNFINHLTDDIPLNISEYMQYVKDCILNKKLNHARLYLKVIYSYGQISNELISVGELESILMQVLQEADLGKDENVVSIQPDIHEDFIDNRLLDEVPLHTEPQIVENTSEVDIDSEIFLQKKYNQLIKQQGIIILKPMKELKRQKLKELAKNYEDMIVFSIGMTEPKRLVLRYKPKEHIFINVSQRVKEANQLYKQQNYKMAAEIYTDLLQIGRPNEYIYANLGLSYLKMDKIKLAIDYLTVATDLSLKTGSDLDFTELIAKLRNEIPVEDFKGKPVISMDVKTFDNDIDEYYGIDNIDSIARLVASGLDVKDACDQLGLTSEQMGIILLIFARECYLQNNYELGDGYLKMAECFKNKTPQMKKLLNDVTRNKKFYSNRDTTNHKKLILLPEY